jgi:hypothetical protein
MAPETVVERSRRSILTAAFGAAAATVAGAVGRPLSVKAANGDYVQVGQAFVYDSTYVTRIRNTSTSGGDGNDNRTMELESVNGSALFAHGKNTGVIARAPGNAVFAWGTANDAIGVFGAVGDSLPFETPQAAGVYGRTSTDLNALGVHGLSEIGVGVRGDTDTGTGVLGVATGQSAWAVRGYANADMAVAVLGEATTGSATAVRGTASGTGGYGVVGEATATSGATRGVFGRSVSPGGRGVFGFASAATGDTVGVLGETFSDSGKGVLGWAAGDSTGVLGFSGSTSVPTARAKTGVYGVATQGPSSCGVFGRTTSGQGVRGQASTGTGGYFASTTGLALEVAGKTSFSRSGRVTIGAGNGFVDVTVPGGLSGAPLSFANLLDYRSGVSIAAVRPNYPSGGKLRIYLNRSVASSTPIAWIVMG